MGVSPSLHSRLQARKQQWHQAANRCGNIQLVENWGDVPRQKQPSSWWATADGGPFGGNARTTRKMCGQAGQALDSFLTESILYTESDQGSQQERGSPCWNSQKCPAPKAGEGSVDPGLPGQAWGKDGALGHKTCAVAWG